MNDKDKLSSKSDETVVEHTLLGRDRALALFHARNHARNHRKPLPTQESLAQQYSRSYRVIFPMIRCLKI